MNSVYSTPAGAPQRNRFPGTRWLELDVDIIVMALSQPAQQF